MWMNIKIDLILLLISVGLVSLADAGRFRDCFTGGKNDVPQEDPLKFMEPYLENSKREFEEKFNHPQQCTGTFTNYDITAWLGEGGNSRAVLGQIKGTVNYNAIKIVHKEDTFGRGPVPEILLEKRIFQSINFPFLIKMESCFKDNSNLYFAMEYSPCGTLPTELPEHVVKFYAAQIVLALHYLHSMNLIYQDLKLENVLIGQDGYIKLADFGFTTRTAWIGEQSGRYSGLYGTRDAYLSGMAKNLCAKLQDCVGTVDSRHLLYDRGQTERLPPAHFTATATTFDGSKDIQEKS